MMLQSTETGHLEINVLSGGGMIVRMVAVGGKVGLLIRKINLATSLIVHGKDFVFDMQMEAVISNIVLGNYMTQTANGSNPQ